jgi:hypothetical protein
MTYEPTHFQLIFNVVALTGLTSLAVICGILKHDNDKLIVELRKRHWHGLKIRAGRPPSQASANRGTIAPAEDREDIRHYVSRRLQDWIEIQKAGIKA